MSDRFSVIEFLAESKDDVNSPTTSTFTSKMSLCRATIAALEESLDADRSVLKKMKSSIKAMHSSGQGHVKNQVSYFENMENLGSHVLSGKREPETDIGSAFFKMSVFAKELSALLKNLVSNINKHLLFPMESLLKGDLKGIKGDMKRPFDKSWKDYDTKVKQVEREKRQLAKDAGMIRSEITGAEIAEEMRKERRMFQLQMCEYLIKANEIKTKKGVDFVQHLVEFYHDQDLFFREGLKVIDQYRTWTEDLTNNLSSLRQAQDEEKRQLIELRNMLKSVCDSDNNAGKTQANVYNLHQLQGNKALGTEKSGFLMKRSEGLRKAWQKRRCFVTDGFLTVSHNKTNKDPVKLNLLTSQLKLVSEDKKQFDLVSHNRTYRFMAEDEHDAMNWVSVLSNSKEDALNRVFGDASSGKDGPGQSSGLKDLTLSIIDEVRRLPGNDICCDCDNSDPTWLSTNLGVLLCIECSGIHRDMGVHVSRIQSLTLDDLGTSELLLAYSIGNDSFNTIMEENLQLSVKPTTASDMEARKSFIRGKYISRNYVVQTCACDPDTLSDELGQAIRSCDLAALLQLFGERADLTVALPGYDDGETALHVAVSLNVDDLGSILPLVDFLCQNIGTGLNKTTISGNTAMHNCAQNNNPEAMKLLLRSKAKTDIENNNGEKPLAIAHRLNHSACVELLEQANSGKFRPMVHIDIAWDLTCQDEDYFASDDDLEDRSSMLPSPMKMGPPENARHRPTSFKDRSKPVIDHSGQRIPPAVPPHQSLNRSRAQTTSQSPSVDQRRGSRPLLPPAIPSKPDSMLRDRVQSAIQPSINVTKDNDADSTKLSPPEPPPKTAISSSGIHHFASFGGKSKNARLANRRAASHDKTALYNTVSKLRVTGDDVKADHTDTLTLKHNRCQSDAGNFVSPRKVHTSRPSFAKKHALSTTGRSNQGSPACSNLSGLSRAQSLLVRNELASRFQKKADATEPLASDQTDFSSLDQLRAGSNTLPVASRQDDDFRSSPAPPVEARGNGGKFETMPWSSRLNENDVTCTLTDGAQPITNRQSAADEKSRSLPRIASLIPEVTLPILNAPVAPPPLPRTTPTSSPPRPRRVQAKYDCEADNQDELTFVENEVIVVTGVEDQEWWVGHVEHQPHRHGVFPVSFVEVLPD